MRLTIECNTPNEFTELQDLLSRSKEQVLQQNHLPDLNLPLSRTTLAPDVLQLLTNTAYAPNTLAALCQLSIKDLIIKYSTMTTAQLLHIILMLEKHALCLRQQYPYQLTSKKADGDKK